MNIINTGLEFSERLNKRKSTKRIIIHHAATSSANVETIHSWHIARGWAGFGYNFYVCKDGSIYKGRGWDTVGAHCASYNSTSIGICFEGNYETETDMPQAQYDAGVELIRLALGKYPGVTEICGHKAHGCTTCPGKHFPLEAMISAAKGSNTGVISGTGSQANPASNEATRELQEALNVDGIRDAAGRPLAVDGIKGANTAAAVKKTLCKAGMLSQGRYKVGSRGEVVKWIQRRLNTLHGSDLTEDGKYGHDTRAAVVEWQRSCGLTVDGKAGVDTLTSLL